MSDHRWVTAHAALHPQQWGTLDPDDLECTWGAQDCNDEAHVTLASSAAEHATAVRSSLHSRLAKPRVCQVHACLDR